MEKDYMKEINEEIKKILNKRLTNDKISVFCNESNIKDCLQYLDQELDSLGCTDEPLDIKANNILIQLINGTYNLIKLYKETDKECKQKLDQDSRIVSDYKTLSKTVENLRKELKTKDNQLQLNKEQLILEKMEKTDLKNKLNNAKHEIQLFHRDVLSEKGKHEYEMNKVLRETDYLKSKFRQNCGEYVSKEGRVVQIVDQYKNEEKKYLDTIEKLQENNQLLLEEIVNLKGEIMVLTRK